MDSELLYDLIHEENPKMAVIYGSFAREENDQLSDLDILLVRRKNEAYRFYRDYPDSIDILVWDENEISRRIKHNDFILATILEEGKIIHGDYSYFDCCKEQIVTRCPSTESIAFNRIEALKCMDHAKIAFVLAKYYSRQDVYRFCLDEKHVKDSIDGDRLYDLGKDSEDRYFSRHFILKCIQNCSFGLGYYKAALKMAVEKKAVTLSALLEASDDNEIFFKELYNFKNELKRNPVLFVKSNFYIEKSLEILEGDLYGI